MSEKDLDYKQSRENLICNIEYMDRMVLNNEFMTYGYDFSEILIPNGQPPLDFNILDPLSKTSELALQYLLGQYLVQIPGSEYKKFHGDLHGKFQSIIEALKDSSLTDDVQAIQNAYKKLRGNLKLNKLEPEGTNINKAIFDVPTLKVFDPKYNKTLIQENKEIAELKATIATLHGQNEEQQKQTQHWREMTARILHTQQTLDHEPKIVIPKSSNETDSSKNVTYESTAKKQSSDNGDFDGFSDLEERERLLSNKTKTEIDAYQHYHLRLVQCLITASSKAMDNETTDEIGEALAALEIIYLKSSSIADMLEIYGRLDIAIAEFERLIGITSVTTPQFGDINYDTDGEGDDSLQEGLEPVELTEQQKQDIEANVERATEPAQRVIDTILERNKQANKMADAAESTEDESDLKLPKTADAEAYIDDLLARTTLRDSLHEESEESSTENDEKSTNERSKREVERGVPRSFLRQKSTSRQSASGRSSEVSNEDLLQEGFVPIINGGQRFNNPPQNESARQGDNPELDGTPLRSPPVVNPQPAGNQADPRARAANGPGIFQPAPQPAPINNFLLEVIAVAQRAHLIHDPSQDNSLHFHAEDDAQKTVKFTGELDDWQISGNDVQKIVEFAIEMKNQFPNTEIWIISQRRDDSDLVAIQKDLETLRALTVANVKIDMRGLEHIERLHANEYRGLAQAQEQLRQQEPNPAHGVGVD